MPDSSHTSQTSSVSQQQGTPGTLTLIGAAELMPAMSSLHRDAISSVKGPVRAVFVDTTAGFETNIGAITAKAVEYYAQRLQTELHVASFRHAQGATEAEVARAIAEIRAANFIFDAVTPVKRARCVAYYNVLINSGTLIGAGLGGVMAISLPTEFTLFSYHFSLLSNLKILFLVSGIARIIVGLVFLPVIREVKEVPTSSAWDIILQVVEISPFRGWRFSAFDGTPPSGQHDDKKASPDS